MLLQSPDLCHGEGKICRKLVIHNPMDVEHYKSHGFETEGVGARDAEHPPFAVAFMHGV